MCSTTSLSFSFLSWTKLLVTTVRRLPLPISSGEALLSLSIMDFSLSTTGFIHDARMTVLSRNLLSFSASGGIAISRMLMATADGLLRSLMSTFLSPHASWLFSRPLLFRFHFRLNHNTGPCIFFVGFHLFFFFEIFLNFQTRGCCLLEGRLSLSVWLREVFSL
uniref:Uncharacterized protein n=1 Tax=Manihot esculenta TaxID=3983 RepID=A0A2C9WB83_MANES